MSNAFSALMNNKMLRIKIEKSTQECGFFIPIKSLLIKVNSIKFKILPNSKFELRMERR